MGEMKKIVVEHYPVEKLPEDLRQLLEQAGLAGAADVRLTVETEGAAKSDERTLRSFLGSAPGLYATPEEAVDFIRSLRDEWEE